MKFRYIGKCDLGHELPKLEPGMVYKNMVTGKMLYICINCVECPCFIPVETDWSTEGDVE